MNATATHAEGHRAQVAVSADPDAVLAALTGPAAISSWWVPCTGDGRPGGELTFGFGDAVVRVRVTDADRHLVRWAVTVAEPVPEWVGSTVEFALTPAGSRATTVTFLHRGLRPAWECFDMCVAGWGQALAGLAEHVEHAELDRAGIRAVG